MFKQIVTAATATATLGLAMGSAAIAAPADFIGTWVNTDAQTRGVTRIVVSPGGGNNLKLQVFGQCQPTDCDWGSSSLITYGDNVQDADHTAATAVYPKSFANSLLTMKLNARNRNLLNLSNFTQFTDNSNRQNYLSMESLKKVTITSEVKEDCVGFNPASTEVKQINGSWKIVDGSHWMYDFGSNQAEAARSLAVIKRYKADKSCFVGRPNPSFKYILAGNSVPTGELPGEDCLSFNPNTAEVKQIGNRWKIVDGNHLMFDFDSSQAEAQQSLAVIKKYGATQTCFVGRPDPSFTYLRR